MRLDPRSRHDEECALDHSVAHRRDVQHAHAVVLGDPDLGEETRSIAAPGQLRDKSADLVVQIPLEPLDSSRQHAIGRIVGEDL